ncbi:hypothetical protein BDD12DRAFT_807153 [Trichophaea hybrida]|nr:hypothetical protein BDD12DRAFT_807153 [Trichophaea hybrida]
MGRFKKSSKHNSVQPKVDPDVTSTPGPKEEQTPKAFNCQETLRREVERKDDEIHPEDNPRTPHPDELPPRAPPSSSQEYLRLREDDKSNEEQSLPVPVLKHPSRLCLKLRRKEGLNNPTNEHFPNPNELSTPDTRFRPGLGEYLRQREEDKQWKIAAEAAAEATHPSREPISYADAVTRSLARGSGHLLTPISRSASHIGEAEQAAKILTTLGSAICTMPADDEFLIPLPSREKRSHQPSASNSRPSNNQVETSVKQQGLQQTVSHGSESNATTGWEYLHQNHSVGQITPSSDDSTNSNKKKSKSPDWMQLPKGFDATDIDEDWEFLKSSLNSNAGYMKRQQIHRIPEPTQIVGPMGKRQNHQAATSDAQIGPQMQPTSKIRFGDATWIRPNKEVSAIGLQIREAISHPMLRHRYERLEENPLLGLSRTEYEQSLPEISREPVTTNPAGIAFGDFEGSLHPN